MCSPLSIGRRNRCFNRLTVVQCNYFLNCDKYIRSQWQIVSSENYNSSTNIIQRSLYRAQEDAMLVSHVLDALGASITIATSRTTSRARVRNESRSGTRNRTRSSGRTRTRIRVSNKSTNNGNNRPRDEVNPYEPISLDDTVLPEHSGPWCINDSTTVAPSALICAICLEELLSKRKPTTTRCGHIFCGECLDQVLREKKKCPKCQTNITRKSCIRLYF
ncbi:hypothetical protein KPH14_004181 [Odynerus spinipes]|uniref:RING-type domain-containing protein n=1 Tax=Odynerus spinipes TaxID=1348599 RepID=A0AAD9RZ08_9HYME|nr:hypothetical protein KPH14_004181 [Odynerus spinipes]